MAKLRIHLVVQGQSWVNHSPSHVLKNLFEDQSIADMVPVFHETLCSQTVSRSFIVKVWPSASWYSRVEFKFRHLLFLRKRYEKKQRNGKRHKRVMHREGSWHLLYTTLVYKYLSKMQTCAFFNVKEMRCKSYSRKEHTFKEFWGDRTKRISVPLGISVTKWDISFPEMPLYLVVSYDCLLFIS